MKVRNRNKGALKVLVSSSSSKASLIKAMQTAVKKIDADGQVYGENHYKAFKKIL